MEPFRTRVPALVAAAVLVGAGLAGTGQALGAASAPASATAPAGGPRVADSEAPAAMRAAGSPAPRREIWQRAEAAHEENRRNPLAGRRWGVYQGPQDQVSAPYERATGNRRALLAKIAERPRTKWYGAWVPPGEIRGSVQRYIEASQGGDADALVQIAVFRMVPWEHEACDRAPTAQERRAYRGWIKQLAKGIGSTPMLVVMQPDGPFLLCAKAPGVTARLLEFATKRLSALPRTSVYIDAGAADWCENGRGNDPERCAQIVKRTGIRYARGFALDSTHYTGPADNIRHGKRIVDILRRDGFGTKHFIVDTAKSGQPTRWEDMIPATKGGLKDNARVCRTPQQRRCVTLGIPPTVRVGAARTGMSAADRAVARRYVDGFVWFGRPWLHNQADPFVMKRALTMARSTPWPGPKL